MMTMVYLQDADNAARLAALDSSGVRLLSATRSRVLRRTVARDVSGHLGVIAGKRAAIYVAGGRLWLAIDGKPWFFDELQATIDRTDDGYAVRITTPDGSYEFTVDDSACDDDTTAFASIEDFSFGLWAARIIEAQERQKVLLEVLVDAPLDAVPEHAHDGPVVLQDPWVKPASAADRRNEKRSAQ
jgi:hypothetical protein